MYLVPIALPNMVNDVVGEIDIASMWQNHYSELLNSNKDVSHKEEVLKSLDELPCNTDVRFDIHDVAQSIKNLKCSKSPGLDGLQAEHFKHSDLTLQCLLAML